MLSPAVAEAQPELVRAVEGWLSATTAEVLAAEMDALAEVREVVPQLADVATPILARVGELDLACPVAKSKAVVRAAANATLEVVAGAGHALLYEDLEATVASVDAALSAGCG